MIANNRCMYLKFGKIACFREHRGSAYAHDDLQEMPDGGTIFGEEIKSM